MAVQGRAGTALPPLSLETAGIKEWAGEVTVNDQPDVLKTPSERKGTVFAAP